ncbi:MAG: DsbA family protein [Nitriliruptoraceae bacterium]
MTNPSTTPDNPTTSQFDLSFGVTFDYLCPWARNLNEHVLTGMRSGANWNVRFVPYSLSQGHVDEGDVDIWERDNPDHESGILALKVGLVVRDHHPEAFLDAHESLFAARHDQGDDIKSPAVLAAALDHAGLDGQPIVSAAQHDSMTQQLANEHRAAVEDHDVWGVPTVIGEHRSVFLRVLDRPDGDADVARQRVRFVVSMVNDEPMIHEFKQTELTR